jgi:hypothetical protein
MTYEVVEDGAWIRVPTRGHKNACCDCALVHSIDYRLSKDGALEVRFRRDNRATAAMRRRKKGPASEGVGT